MSGSVLKVDHQLYDDSTISVALFTSTNDHVKQLRKCVMSGDLSVAIIKPTVVISTFPVLLAANKAVHFMKSNTMTTRNVHSEILYCLSPTKNISESFKIIGTSDADSNVLVVIVDDKDDSKMAEVKEVLQTEPCSLEKLEEFSDNDLITKMYKITSQELQAYSLAEAAAAHISAKEIYLGGKFKG